MKKSLFCSSLFCWLVVFGLTPVLAQLEAFGLSGSGSDDHSESSKPSAGEESNAPDGAWEMYDDPYFRLPFLNLGLPPLPGSVDLESPRSSLSNFMDACEENDFDRAARSLNLNAFDPAEQNSLGPDLAKKLQFVLEQKVWIDWGQIPDRPDGEKFGYSLEQEATEGSREGPKRVIHLGTIDLDRRVEDLWLQRVKTPDQPPVWVFSRQSVKAVPGLYEAFGPTQFQRRLPAFLKEHEVAGIAAWQWIGIILFLALGWFVGWAFEAILEQILRRSPGNWATTLARSIRGPVAVIVGLVVFHILASGALRLAGPVMMIVEPLIFVLIVLAVTWLAQRVIDYTSAYMSHRYEEGDDESANVQAAITRITMAKHFFSALVLVVGLVIALSRFEWFQMIGYSLLASAGVAALVFGVAAQRSLSNLFAGVQLAITQPVRVNDAVLFEGEWGWIEEIAVTYVVIRTWDMRRLVVPTAHLVEKPIENWTRNGENMMKPVYLYADYRVNFAALRDELQRILENSEDWDKEVPPILQVTGCTQETVEVRALCSAKDPSSAWNLHCEVREQLVAFLRDLENGEYLPRTRVIFPGSQQPALTKNSQENHSRDHSSDREEKGQNRGNDQGKGTRQSQSKGAPRKKRRVKMGGKEGQKSVDDGGEGEAK